MVVGGRDPGRRYPHYQLRVTCDRARAGAGAPVFDGAQARGALSRNSRAGACALLVLARAHSLGNLPAASAGGIVESAHSQRLFGLGLGDPGRRCAGDIAWALEPAAQSPAFHTKPVRCIPLVPTRRSPGEPGLRRTRCPAAAMARGGRLRSRSSDRLWNDARSRSLRRIRLDESTRSSLASIATRSSLFDHLVGACEQPGETICPITFAVRLIAVADADKVWAATGNIPRSITSAGKNAV